MKVDFKLLCDFDGEPDILVYPITLLDTYKSAKHLTNHLEKIASEILKEHTVCYSVKCSVDYHGEKLSLMAYA